MRSLQHGLKQMVNRAIPVALVGIGPLILTGPMLVPTTWAADAPPPAPPAGPTGNGPMTDIHDIKPLLPMGADLGWLIWLAVGVVALVLLAVLAWWLWRRRKPAVDAPVAVPLPAPEEEAYALLDGLAAEDHSDLKRFYFRLSAIFRRYTERRYGFPAAEMTTEELLPAMARLDLGTDLMLQVREFCRRADPIKFAGAAGELVRLAHELAFVRDFVRRTTPVALELDEGLNHKAGADAVPPMLPMGKG